MDAIRGSAALYGDVDGDDNGGDNGELPSISLAHVNIKFNASVVHKLADTGANTICVCGLVASMAVRLRVKSD